METEKKNTAILTVIAVVTLLVGVVGATFAYFTATTKTEGTGSNTNVNTRSSLGGVKLSLETAYANGDIAYPGGYAINGAKIIAKNIDGATNNFKVNFDLNYSVNNTTADEVKVTLYKTNSVITAPLSGCKLSNYTKDGSIRYTYGKMNSTNNELQAPVNGKYESTCTLNVSGTELKSETLAAKSNKSYTLKSSDVSSLSTTSSDAGTASYYYLVVEYPETNKTQTPGGDITATITSVTNPNAVMQK